MQGRVTSQNKIITEMIIMLALAHVGTAFTTMPLFELIKPATLLYSAIRSCPAMQITGDAAWVD